MPPARASRFVLLALLALIPLALPLRGQESPPVPPGESAPKSPSDTAPPPNREAGVEAPVEGVQLNLDRVKAAIDSVTAAPDLDEETRKMILDLYGAARTRLEAAAKSQEAAARFKEAIEKAPARTQEIRKQLAEPAPAEPATIPVPAGEDPEVILARERAELATLKSRLEMLGSQIQGLQTRITKAREAQVAAREKLREVDENLKVATPPGELATLTAARRASQEAQKAALLAEISMLEQEVLSQPMRLELLRAERDQASQEAARREAELKKLEETVDRQRTRDAEAARRRTEKARREAAGKHPVIARAAELNSQFASESAEVASEHKKATPDRQFLADQSDQVQEHFQEMSTQLGEAGLAGVDASVMISQRKRLSQLLAEASTVAARWKGKLADVQARRFRATMELRALSDLEAQVDVRMQTKVESTVGEAERAEIAAELRKLLSARVEILTQLQKNCDSLLETLRPISASYKAITTTVQEFQLLLDEYLLWIPNTTLPDAATLGQIWSSAKSFFAPGPWKETFVVLSQDLIGRPVVPALVFLTLLALLATRLRTIRELEATGVKSRRIESDHIGLTLIAVLMSLLLALPVPVLLGFTGYRLLTGPESTPFARGVGEGLVSISFLSFMLGAFLSLCRRRGVVEVHLRWRDRSTRLLRRHLRWLYPVLTVTTFVSVAAETQVDENMRNQLGRLGFVVGMVAVAVFVQRLLRPKGGIPEPTIQRHPERWLARLRWLWYPIAVGAPVTLGIMAVLGYYYTATQLQDRLVWTVWLVVGALLINSLAFRWLLIEQRRLAVQQAKEKREAEEQRAREAEEQRAREAESQTTPEDPEKSSTTPVPTPTASQPAPPPVETPEVDISTINGQTRQLLRTLLGTSVVVGLWLVWSSVLPALGILGDIQLWDVGSEEAPAWITLEHIALAIITVILTTAAARNLPGVLEIAVLKNLPLDAGSRYAISSICQYVLTAIGAVVIFNSLGLKWSSIQWLVAALSVGLGFGLQEIIANFVCGIILLFERPMRVGDIITVGDVSGTVTRIRIRATTILNWEKKELVVPNKEFVTGRLLNWTLTDTLNRIEINVGVAYGTDTRRVREVLLEIADAHPMVLKDPPPVVLFNAFGASSLDFKYFIFLPDFSNRLVVMNEIRTGIAERFAQEGLEIAFPQLDLHLKDVPRALEREGREGSLSSTG